MLLLQQLQDCLQPKHSHHGNTAGPPGQSQCAVSGGSMPTGVIETVHPASGSCRSTAQMKMIGFRGGMGEFLTGRTWCGVVPPANLLFPQRKLKAAAWTGFSNDPSMVATGGTGNPTHAAAAAALPTHAAAAPEPHVRPVISHGQQISCRIACLVL